MARLRAWAMAEATPARSPSRHGVGQPAQDDPFCTPDVQTQEQGAEGYTRTVQPLAFSAQAGADNLMLSIN